MVHSQFRFLFAVALAFLLSLPACAPAPLSQGRPLLSPAQRVITPYTGPVEVSFDSSLISPVLSSYGYKKTMPRQTMALAQDEDTFSIQAIPPGHVMFRETFTKGRQMLDELREIRIADTSKRYTLHVQKQDKHGNGGQVLVNINGTDWIKEGDFHGQTQEVTRQMLLLNAKNSLRVRLSGKAGSQVTVTLVEGGEAGTVLRRRNRLGKPGETHETHVRRNDINVFDPNDPASLGGLEPYSQIPKSEDGRSLPSLSFNGGIPATLSAGEVQLKLKAPVQDNLNALLLQYNGIVTDTLSHDEYLVFMDLSKVKLAQLHANLQALNAHVDASAAIEQVAFDSLEGAQMLALMTELLLDAHQGSRVQAIDINPVLNSNASSSFEGIAAGGKSMHAQDSWWLNQTSVLKAWDYSLGFNRAANRPVYVAVVDSDFKYMDVAKQNNEDLQSQVLTTRAAAVYFKRFPEAGVQAGYRQLLTILDSAGGDPLDQNDRPIPINFFSVGTNTNDKQAHGTSQASTVASVVNNGKGIAGVAPHAKIIPIKIGTFRGTPPAGEANSAAIAMGWDLRLAIEAAGRLKADIVSVTNSTVIDGISNWLNEVNKISTGSQYGWLNALQRQVDLFAQPRNDAPASPGGSDSHQIGNSGICVFNAGNAGNHVRHTLPAGKLKNIVIAGAVQENLQKAIFGDPVIATTTLFTGGSCPATSGSVSSCSLDGNGEGASAWWLGAGKMAPSSSVYPQLKSEIEAWENGLGAQNLKLWTPGTNMAAVGHVNSGMGISTIWGGTSAATPFAAGSLALLKALKPTLTVSELLSGSLLKYKPASPYSDSMLKDYYAVGTNRKGLRIAPFSLTTPVLDLERTILEHSEFYSSTNKIETIVGTLRKDSSGRPYLQAQQGQTYDLSMFVDDPTFQGNSNYSDIYKNAFARESRQLELDGWQTFWNQYGTNAADSQVLLSTLQDKQVSVQGWRYSPSLTTAELRIEPLALKEGSSGGFSTLNVRETLPDNAPPDVNVWLLRGTQGKKVYPNEYIGIGIDGQDLDGIRIFIDGRLQEIKYLANNYVAFGLVPEVTPGVKDVIIQLAGGGSLTLEQALEVIALPHLQEIQSIPTTGATAMKAFDIGSETFMAVTNFYNQNPNAYNLYVDLFRWNGNQFTASQRIPAHGPYDIETFTINGEHYLAVAEYYHSQNHTFDFPSRIYKWNGSQFALFQSVPTHGASAWKHFTIGPDHYLMVANTATGTGGNVVNVNTQSELFKWNGTQFVSIQSIPTTAARDWEHLQVGEEHFLAVANEYNGSSYASSTNIFSEIYRWNGSQFTLLQRVHSEGARDWEAFSIGDRHFLALANLWGSTNSPSTAEKSKIYEWNGSAFVVAQTFEGLEAYALSWEHFTVND